MKNMVCYETQRIALPSLSRGVVGVVAPEPLMEPALDEAELLQEREPLFSEQTESGALTVHFNDEKTTLERKVAQDIKRLHTQLKLLQTDLLPSPVRPRVNHIEELIDSLVGNFQRLLTAQTSELELYAHRVASSSSQLISRSDFPDLATDTDE